MSTLWPTTPLSAVLRVAGRVSNPNAFSTLSRAIPKKTAFPGQQQPHQIQLWSGLQGHHHQRFMSSSTRSLVKTQSSQLAGLSSRSLIAAGAVTTFIFGPLIWARNIAHCAAETTTTPSPAVVNPTPPIPTPTPNSAPQIPGGGKPFVNTQDLSFGTAMGLCSGYLCKKLGKMFVLVAGLGFISLQLLANAGYINVNWGLIESKFTEKFDLDKDGKVTAKDAKFGLNQIIELLTRNFQFKSTFAGGFYIGFRYG
ncbi:FUN14 domain-containing protein 1 [Mortierella sp. AD094]|nr:FUN14 domain-containing protein 1 [Mortierella sp. AD094]